MKKPAPVNTPAIAKNDTAVANVRGSFHFVCKKRTNGDIAQARIVAMMTGTKTTCKCTIATITSPVSKSISMVCAERVASLPKPWFQRLVFMNVFLVLDITYCIGYGKVRMNATIPATVRTPVIQRSLRESTRLRSNGRSTPESALMNAMKVVKVE